MSQREIWATLVDKNRMHCALCGKTFDQKWQRQVHEMAYLSQGSMCRGAVK